MDSVLRGAAVYAFVFIVFRLAGKRTLAQMTPFDLVLTIIISETLQQALIDNDNSITNAFILVLTLVGMAILMAFLKQKSQTMEKLLDGVPVIVVEKNRQHQDRMEMMRIDEADIMDKAREQEGLRTLDEVEFAVVETDGKVTVIPKQGSNGTDESKQEQQKREADQQKKQAQERERQEAQQRKRERQRQARKAAGAEETTS